MFRRLIKRSIFERILQDSMNKILHHFFKKMLVRMCKIVRMCKMLQCLTVIDIIYKYPWMGKSEILLKNLIKT